MCVSLCVNAYLLRDMICNRIVYHNTQDYVLKHKVVLCNLLREKSTENESMALISPLANIR